MNVSKCVWHKCMEIADQARTKQFIVGGLKWTKKAKNSTFLIAYR